MPLIYLILHDDETIGRAQNLRDMLSYFEILKETCQVY